MIWYCDQNITGQETSAQFGPQSLAFGLPGWAEKRFSVLEIINTLNLIWKSTNRGGDIIGQLDAGEVVSGQIGGVAILVHCAHQELVAGKKHASLCSLLLFQLWHLVLNKVSDFTGNQYHQLLSFWSHLWFSTRFLSSQEVPLGWAAGSQLPEPSSIFSTWWGSWSWWWRCHHRGGDDGGGGGDDGGGDSESSII